MNIMFQNKIYLGFCELFSLNEINFPSKKRLFLLQKKKLYFLWINVFFRIEFCRLDIAVKKICVQKFGFGN